MKYQVIERPNLALLLAAAFTGSALSRRSRAWRCRNGAAVNLSGVVLLAGIAAQAFATGGAGAPGISTFNGREFKGMTPSEIKWEATSERIENGKSIFRINRGHLGEREVVWVDRPKEADQKEGPVRVVTDIKEVPRLSGKDVIVVSCYWADGENKGKQLQGVVAVIRPDLENPSPYLNLPFRVTLAWTADPSSGRIQKLDPRRLDCAGEEED